MWHFICWNCKQVAKIQDKHIHELISISKQMFPPISINHGHGIAVIEQKKKCCNKPCYLYIDKKALKQVPAIKQAVKIGIRLIKKWKEEVRNGNEHIGASNKRT